MTGAKGAAYRSRVRTLPAHRNGYFSCSSFSTLRTPGTAWATRTASLRCSLESTKPDSCTTPLTVFTEISRPLVNGSSMKSAFTLLVTVVSSKDWPVDS